MFREVLRFREVFVFREVFRYKCGPFSEQVVWSGHNT